MPRKYTEVEISRFNKILSRLSDASMIDLSRFDLIVHGGGGKNKEFYKQLQEDSGVEIIMTGRRSGWLRFFSFIPAEAGLVRILDPLRLKPLFEQLGASCFSEIFYIPRDLTTKIATKIFQRDTDVLAMLDEHEEYLYLRAQLDDYLRQDPECYYLYDYRFGPETAAVIRTVFNGL